MIACVLAGEHDGAWSHAELHYGSHDQITSVSLLANNRVCSSIGAERIFADATTSEESAQERPGLTPTAYVQRR